MTEVNNANNDAARRAAEEAARRAQQQAQQAQQAQAQQAQQQQQVQQQQQQQVQPVAGADVAERTRDVVAAASVDNDRAAVAARAVSAETPVKEAALPEMPPAAVAKPVTPADLTGFQERAPADPAERGRQAADLAARSTRQYAESLKSPDGRQAARQLQRTENEFRHTEAGRLETEAASTTDPAKKQELTKLAESLRTNLPTDPQQRAIVEGLAAGKPPASQLGQAEAKLAQQVLRDFPPTNASRDTVSGFHGAMERLEAQKQVDARVAQVDAAYKKNGWADDLPVRPGTPGADQALIANAVDIGRQTNPDGTPQAKDFRALSPQATRDTIGAIENFKRDNPGIFGNPPPTDPGELQARNTVNAVDAAVRRHADIQGVTQQIDGVRQSFDDVKNAQGVLGNTADALKNRFGSENGSRAVSAAVDGLNERRANVEALYNHTGDDASFQKAFGDATKGAAEAIDTVAQRVQQYAGSQKAWVDGLTTAAATTAALAAAPFTGGASVLGLATAAGIGATVKVAGTGLEAITGDGRYPSNVVSDALKGALAGATGPLAARVGTMLSTQLGGRVFGNLAGFGIAGGGDGAVNATAGSLLDGNNLQTALKDGLSGAAFGAVLGGGGAALGNFFRRVDFDKSTLGANGANMRLRGESVIDPVSRSVDKRAAKLIGGNPIANPKAFSSGDFLNHGAHVRATNTGGHIDIKVRQNGQLEFSARASGPRATQDEVSAAATRLQTDPAFRAELHKQIKSGLEALPANASEARRAGSLALLRALESMGLN